jgi:hypothetical protein
MISFAYVGNNGLPVIGHVQTHCMRQLMACKGLSSSKDQSGGLVGKLAAKGIATIPKQSLATRDVIFVTDHVAVQSGCDVHEECDFLLNGQWYRMTTGYAIGNLASGNWNSWNQYPPVSVCRIAIPRSLAAKKPLVAQVQPAPMNHVAPPPGGPGQTAPSGFYATITQNAPTDTYASMAELAPKLNHYANMAELMPKETFYMTA